ncbi:hypothetical protein ACJZ2D_007559 [Fusarium nematophilum]
MSTLLRETESLLLALRRKVDADFLEWETFSMGEKRTVWGQAEALRSCLEAIKTFQTGQETLTDRNGRTEHHGDKPLQLQTLPVEFPAHGHNGQGLSLDTTAANMPAEPPSPLASPMDRYLHDTEKCPVVPMRTNKLRSREQRKRAIGFTLGTLAACSSYAMEHSARPGAQPSAALFVTAIGVYASSAGSLYYLHSDQRHLDFCLLCGGLLGFVAGLVVGWDYQEILFRSLPGFILASLLVGIYCLWRR